MVFHKGESLSLLDRSFSRFNADAREKKIPIFNQKNKKTKIESNNYTKYKIIYKIHQS